MTPINGKRYKLVLDNLEYYIFVGKNDLGEFEFLPSTTHLEMPNYPKYKLIEDLCAFLSTTTKRS